jgi:hypothetical protein
MAARLLQALLGWMGPHGGIKRAAQRPGLAHGNATRRDA